MTVAVSRVSRRRFLAGTLVAGAGLLIPGRLRAEQPAVDANRFALLSDVHLSADRSRQARGVNLVEHFLSVREEILALRPRPAAVLIAGDCAFNDGLPGDYALVRELVAPLRKAGLPLHLLMGNHDRQQNLWEAFPESKPRGSKLPPGKHVSVVETPHVNWFLLDSMDGAGVVGGRFGEAQLQWLADALDAHADRPALVMAHHYLTPPEKNGLVDTEAFLKVLRPRKQVKGYFFGHSHRWSTGTIEGLHIVNLPTTAYVFDKKQPCAWVDAQVRANGIVLRINALDRQHPLHGKVFDLAWLR